MYTKKKDINGRAITEYNRVVMFSSDESSVDDGWYNIHGLRSLRPNQAQADFTKIYLDGISI